MAPGSGDNVLRCYRHPDRETGVSCSECGRGICPDCMTFGPVGIRCPDHSGKPQGAKKVVQSVQRRTSRSPGIVTKWLIGINVGVYLLQLAQGAPITGNGGSIYEKGVLVVGALDSNGHLIGLLDDEWWRLITSAFLHYGPLHLAMNMYSLWLIGTLLEQSLGAARYLAIYLVSGLAGAAGALVIGSRSELFDPGPSTPTVGASGAIFGILGAAIVLERQRTYVLGGSAVTLLALNLAFTFAVPNISIGGHVGGLIGGALCILLISQFGRRSAVYARNDILAWGGIAAVAVLSFLVAYWKVRGYT
jgi:membrane associated rhomboid family serine protease